MTKSRKHSMRSKQDTPFDSFIFCPLTTDRMAQFGYIEIATSNASRMSNAQDGDLLIYTDSATQSICFGSHEGANAALRVSSNAITCHGYYTASNGYFTNGLNLNLVRTVPTSIACVDAWSSNFYAFNFSSNVPAFGFANASGAVMLTMTSNNQIQANSNDTVTLPAYTWQGSGNSNTGLYHASNNQIGICASGSNVATITSGGMAVASNVNALNLTGYKNRIINGDVRIDQRNRGAMAAIANNSLTYGPDRIATYTYGSFLVSAGQSTLVTPPSGFQYAFRVTVTTASATIAADTNTTLMSIALEGAMTSDFLWGTAAAHPVMISFWAYSSVAHTYCLVLRNSGATRSFVSPFTCPVNTWTYYTIPVPGDTGGTWSMTSMGVALDITTAIASQWSTGTSNAWIAGNFISITGNNNGFISTVGNSLYITGLQMEKGRIATPFEQRPYATELLLCQRYYYKLYNDSPYHRVGLMSADSTTVGYSIITFPTRMRVIPSSIAISSTSHFVFGGATVTSIARDANNTSAEHGVIQINGSGFTAGKVYPIFTNNQAPGNAWIAFTAEM